MKRKKAEPAPTPVKQDQRICFGILYFKTEEEAQAMDKIVREQGRTYNGGYFDGMPCGRSKTWDHVDPELGQLYACTH